MCLAVPVKVLRKVDDTHVAVDKDGVELTVGSAFFPDLQPGDYCLIHDGFVIQTMDNDEGEERIAMIADLYAGEANNGS